MKILARSEKNREYLYIPSSARAVSAKNAVTICDRLNAAGYKLLAGEIWHIHDVDQYDTAYYYARYQRFTIRSGKIYDTVGRRTTT